MIAELALPPVLAAPLRRLRRPWANYWASQAIAQRRDLVARLLPQLAADGTLPPGPIPDVLAVQLTRSAVVIARTDTGHSGKMGLVVKLPLTAEAEQSLLRHREVLTTLRQRPELEVIQPLLPQPVAWGEFDHQVYYVETALPGEPSGALVDDPGSRRSMQEAASRAIEQLHAGTVRYQQVDSATFARLAGDDLALLERLAARWPHPSALRDALARLEEQLRQCLWGQTLPLCWTHGDFWPGNLLVRHPGGPLSGILDWDRATPDDLPLQDIFHLLIYTRKLWRQSELGEEVLASLRSRAWDGEERQLLDDALARFGLSARSDVVRAALWLYWLRQVATNLRRYPGRKRDRRWLEKNVFLALQQGRP